MIISGYITQDNTEGLEGTEQFQEGEGKAEMGEGKTEELKHKLLFAVSVFKITLNHGTMDCYDLSYFCTNNFL